jgi:hypothetical protein
MTAAAVGSTTAVIPSPRHALDDSAADLRAAGTTTTVPAVAYQRVLHQLVRRELRLLADLAAWAPADDAVRITELTRHASLIGRVLLHHHAAERDAVWPALLRTAGAAEARPAVDEWTARCARIDHMLRDVATAARQWGVALTCPARDAFAMACLDVADAVHAQTADEERVLLPLLGKHLHAEDWAGIRRTSRCNLPASDQLLVLGLALEDASAAERARLLEGVPSSVRWAWRLGGERRYRAVVVRLRGEPPAR